MLDRHDCYELCVQSPRHVVSLLKGVHGAEPLVLREDFCGTAGVSRRWIEESMRTGQPARAIAIDLEPQVIERARSDSAASGADAGLDLHVGDCTAKNAPAGDQGADVVFVGNFSIGYCHARTTLMGYLKRTLARLRLGTCGPGVFACDTYGGAGAFRLGGIRRRHPSRGREVIHYIWQHEAADPLSAMVTNSISFEIELDGEIVERLPRAFVYRWRLWSIAELREAMLEVGFRNVEVYRDLNVAPGERPMPLSDPADLGEDWIVLVVGRL